MKSKQFIFFGTLFFFICGSLYGAEKLPVNGFVNWVYDGDTIHIRSGYSVRLLGINAPEIEHGEKPGECMGREATVFAIKLLKGKQVRLQYDKVKKDRYHRLLAFIFLHDGKMANLIMVQKGYAYVMTVPPNFEYRKVFLRAQRKAIDEKLGIWSRCIPEKREYYYIGNARNFIFHRPSCKYGRRISSRNRVIFPDRKQAFYQGYRPCRRCKP